MANLSNKVALVTGASKGIGAGIAKHLAACGASVAVNYATSREGADRVVAVIEAAGGKAIAVQADVSKTAEVERMFAEVTSKLGRVDIVVNNAGRFILGPLETVTEENYRHNFDTNVLGVLLVCQRAVPQFGPDGGSIINIGSLTTEQPNPFALTYGASKGGVDFITKALAIELGPKKIRINEVLPGVTETEGATDAGAMTEERKATVAKRTALGRVGTPEDIALVVAFLASDDARWITGRLIGATGGMH
jgi:3-oxoacyl-[acyl-carrier protein] reductase